jgi:hypothetical protein
MKLSDYTSLFQLSVALNVGFGALIAFAEPGIGRIRTLTNALEKIIIELTKERDDSFVNPIFEICAEYQKTRADVSPSIYEYQFWFSIPARLIFCGSALVALIMLIISSASPDTVVDVRITFVGVALNVLPLIECLALCLLNVTAKMQIEPIIMKQIINASNLRQRILVHHAQREVASSRRNPSAHPC